MAGYAKTSHDRRLTFGQQLAGASPASSVDRYSAPYADSKTVCVRLIALAALLQADDRAASVKGTIGGFVIAVCVPAGGWRAQQRQTVWARVNSISSLVFLLLISISFLTFLIC